MGKVGKILKGIGKKGRDISRSVVDGIGPALVDVAEDKQTALYQKVWNKKLNPKIGYGVAAVGTVGALTYKASESKNRHELGYMSAQDGLLSNMVGGATLSPLVEQVQSGEYDTSRVDNTWNSRGADGDIVFALHNMR